MSVYDITLASPTEKYAPPETLLRLTSVDDLAFLSVETYEEVDGVRTFKSVADMTVSLPALREAINLLSHDRDREDCRPVDERGEKGARIAGHRLVVSPL